MKKENNPVSQEKFKTLIGGQALIEGIMMQGPDKRSIVVRGPEGLVTKVEPLKKRTGVAKWPLIRGVVNFASSMVSGVKALMYSAEFFPEEDEDAQPSKFEQWLEKKLGSEKLEKAVVSFSVFLGVLFSVGLFFSLTRERLLQSPGRTIYNMITQGLGAIINIIMDPILIFGLFGFPRMEVAGAAVATVAGQIIGMLLSLFFNFTKNKDIHIRIRGFRPHGETIGNIYRVGLPSIIMMSIGSVMTYGINKIMLMFSATAVSVFGIYFKLQSFIFMPVFGLNNGMVPIIAYNYGARRPSRILQTVRFGALLAEIIMFIGTVIFQTCPAFLLALFDASDDMLALGIPALRIISINFLFAGLGISFGSVFQAMGNGMYSLIVSACRQLVVLLPVAYLLAVTMGVHFVWWAFPASELASIVLSVVMFLRIYRKKIQPLYEEAEV